jgi:hypothetical protein
MVGVPCFHRLVSPIFTTDYFLTFSVLVIASRKQYTVDVALACIVAYFVFLTFCGTCEDCPRLCQQVCLQWQIDIRMSMLWKDKFPRTTPNIHASLRHLLQTLALPAPLCALGLEPSRRQAGISILNSGSSWRLYIWKGASLTYSPPSLVCCMLENNWRLGPLLTWMVSLNGYKMLCASA